MVPFAPLTPEQASALATFAQAHGRSWKAELRAAWMTASAEPTLHRLRNTHGPSWLASVRLEVPATPDFTTHAHPVLAVPCPTCHRGAGAWCVRPSGHRADKLHKDRAAAADVAFVEHHGDDAAILRGEGGRWIIDPHGSVRD